MADEKALKQAKAVFGTLCKSLDDRKWSYDKDEDRMMINTSVRGDDIPIQLRYIVDADKFIVNIYSYFPFDIPEDKRIEAALAATIVNDNLAFGSIDYNIAKDVMVFRLSTFFMDSLISVELLSYMTSLATAIVDKYNDKFLMLGKGMLTYKDFFPKAD